MQFNLFFKMSFSTYANECDFDHQQANKRHKLAQTKEGKCCLLCVKLRIWCGFFCLCFFKQKYVRGRGCSNFLIFTSDRSSTTIKTQGTVLISLTESSPAQDCSPFRIKNLLRLLLVCSIQDQISESDPASSTPAGTNTQSAEEQPHPGAAWEEGTRMHAAAWHSRGMAQQ